MWQWKHTRKMRCLSHRRRWKARCKGGVLATEGGGNTQGKEENALPRKAVETHGKHKAKPVNALSHRRSRRVERRRRARRRPVQQRGVRAAVTAVSAGAGRARAVRRVGEGREVRCGGEAGRRLADRLELQGRGTKTGGF